MVSWKMEKENTIEKRISCAGQIQLVHFVFSEQSGFIPLPVFSFTPLLSVC